MPAVLAAFEQRADLCLEPLGPLELAPEGLAFHGPIADAVPPEQEYHARKHDTTGREPRDHWLSKIARGRVRSLPAGIELDEVFLHRAIRHVRKDGTVSFRGRLFEVRPELCEPGAWCAYWYASDWTGRLKAYRYLKVGRSLPIEAGIGARSGIQCPGIRRSKARWRETRAPAR